MLLRRALLSILVCLNLLLLYNLIWSDNGIFAYLELKSRHAKLAERLEAMNEKSLDLSQEIRWLKTDRVFTEKMARAQMNYLKNNEILYQFPKTPQAEGKGAEQNGNQN